MKALVVYDTRYGSTQEIAHALGEGLGAGTRVALVRENLELQEYDLLVLGSPIYSGRLLPGVIDFLEREQVRLRTKRIALFIVCGDTGSVQVQGQETGGKAYLKEVANFLGGDIVGQEAFLGRMQKEKLDQDDQAILEDFSNILGVNFPDFNGMDLAKAKGFGEKLKEILAKSR